MANLNVGFFALTVNGNAESDTITYTPGAYSDSGTFSLAGLNTVFNFSASTRHRRRFHDQRRDGHRTTASKSSCKGPTLAICSRSIRATAPSRSYAYNTVTLQPVTLGTDIQTLTAQGLTGKDTFQVIPAVGIPAFGRRYGPSSTTC